MVYWKALLGRVALSTASLTVIGSLGGFLGAILGAVCELMLQALFSVVLEPLAVIPLFIVLGVAVALTWGFLVVLRNRPVEVVPPAGQ